MILKLHYHCKSPLIYNVNVDHARYKNKHQRFSLSFIYPFILSRQRVIRLPEPSEAIVNITWSSNGYLLAVAEVGVDYQLFLWSWEENRLLSLQNIVGTLPGPPLQVLCWSIYRRQGEGVGGTVLITAISVMKCSKQLC